MPSSECNICGRLLTAGYCQSCDPKSVIKKMNNLLDSKRDIDRRVLDRLKAADRVVRELRYIIAQHGMVDGSNSGRLMELLGQWLSQAGDDKFERPELDDQK